MTTSFNKAKHQYLIDGKPATGVTTIIGVLAKPALIGWAAKMAVEYVKEKAKENALVVREEFVRDELKHEQFYVVTGSQLEEAKSAHTKKKEAAGEHGTDTHALVEGYVNLCLQKEGRPNAADDFGGGEEIRLFIKWAKENVDHFLFSERQMYNREIFIAGTADFAYVGKDGRKYMADFKTSSGIYGIDYWLQVAAYRMLAEAEGDSPYDGATIVRLGKDGAFEVQQLFDYETYKIAFLSCLTLYRAQAALKGMVVREEKVKNVRQIPAVINREEVARFRNPEAQGDDSAI